MRIRLKAVKTNQAGITLIEAVVSLAMITVVGAVLSQFAANASDIFTGVERGSIINDTMEGLRPILASKAACTANLINQPLQTSATGASILPNVTDQTGVKRPGIAQFDPATNSLAKSLSVSVGVPFRGVNLKNLVLVDNVRVSNDTHLVDLVAEFETNGRTTQTFKRFFPLMVVVQGGSVKECWARIATGKAASNSVCVGVSGGTFSGQDQQTKECGYANGQWIPGNETTASCPGGSLPPTANNHDNCAVVYPPNFQDTFQGTPVTFQGGSTEKIGREPLIMTLDAASKTCTCHWATDLPAANYAGAKCMIYCAIN